jgi:hypothetical protein
VERSVREKKRQVKGKWVTHRQRCSIAGERPEPSDCAEDAFADSVQKAIGSLDLGETMWLKGLEAEWDELVGADAAKHARPGRYSNGRLVVFVDSAVWMSELVRYRRDDMLNAMQRRFGRDKISSLSLQPDPEAKG